MKTFILLFVILSIFILPDHASARKRIPRGAMSYVVGRGCTYLTYYVRDNYFRFQLSSQEAATVATNPQKINWVTWMYDTCVQNYVPLELVHALINCGKNYALYALNPPQSILDALHPDFSVIPGVAK